MLPSVNPFFLLFRKPQIGHRFFRYAHDKSITYMFLALLSSFWAFSDPIKFTLPNNCSFPRVGIIINEPFFCYVFYKRNVYRLFNFVENIGVGSKYACGDFDNSKLEHKKLVFVIMEKQGIIVSKMSKTE